MSKNIKVQIVKSNQDIKLENLLDSYSSLKSILSPNLNENNNLFMNSLIDLIISQINIFLVILNLNESKKLYEVLNINNQKLSKQIAYLYELSKQSKKNPNKSLPLLEKENSNNNNIKYKKINNTLKDSKQSFNIVESDNFELIENKNKINNKEKQKEKKINEKEKEKEERYKIIKKEKEEREKLKEKEKLIKELKKKEKEKEKENKIREKAKEILKKSKIKEEKEYNKLQIKKNSNNERKKIKCFRNININKNKKTNLENYLCKTEKEKEKDKDKESEIKTTEKKIQEKNISEKCHSIRNKTPNKEKDNNKFKYYLFDYNKEKNIYTEEKEEKINRKNKRAKTVLYDASKIPNLISIENIPINNYISVSFTNRFLNKSKSPKKTIKKDDLIQMILEEENIKNKLKKIKSKNNNNNYRTKTDSSSQIKIKNDNINLNDEHFSLDDFLIPYSNKKGEELFLTKSGNVFISKEQKEFLEDYINNNYFEEEDNKSKTERKRIYNYNNISPRNKTKKGITNKYKGDKGVNNKKSNMKGKNNQYDLKDITNLLQMFQNPIDEHYLRKRNASLFDKSIFRICHKVIDNYKELENKEDIFSFKSKKKSRSKTRTKSLKYFNNSKTSIDYKKLYSN